MRERAARIKFALSCLREGTKRGRLEARYRREQEELDARCAANLAARWRG